MCQRHGGELPLRLHVGHRHHREAHDHRHGVESHAYLRRRGAGDHAELRRLRQQPEHKRLRHPGHVHHRVHGAEQRGLVTVDHVLGRQRPQLPVLVRAGHRDRQQEAGDDHRHESHGHVRRREADGHALLVYRLGQQPERDHGDDHRPDVRLGDVHDLDVCDAHAVDGLHGCHVDELLLRLRCRLDHDPAAAADDHRVEPDGDVRRSGAGDHARLRGSRQRRDRCRQPHDGGALRDGVHGHVERGHHAEHELLGRHLAELRHLVHGRVGDDQPQADHDHRHQPDGHLRRHDHDAAGAADGRHRDLADGRYAADVAGKRWRLDRRGWRVDLAQVAVLDRCGHDLERLRPRADRCDLHAPDGRSDHAGVSRRCHVPADRHLDDQRRDHRSQVRGLCVYRCRSDVRRAGRSDERHGRPHRRARRPARLADLDGRPWRSRAGRADGDAVVDALRLRRPDHRHDRGRVQRWRYGLRHGGWRRRCDRRAHDRWCLESVRQPQLASARRRWWRRCGWGGRRHAVRQRRRYRRRPRRRERRGQDADELQVLWRRRRHAGRRRRGRSRWWIRVRRCGHLGYRWRRLLERERRRRWRRVVRRWRRPHQRRRRRLLVRVRLGQSLHAGRRVHQRDGQRLRRDRL